MAAPTLVFVHGRGQEFKNPDQLLRKWLAALNGGLTKADDATRKTDRVVFPFYGDVLYRVTAESAGKTVRLESIDGELRPGPFTPGAPPGCRAGGAGAARGRARQRRDGRPRARRAATAHSSDAGRRAAAQGGTAR